MVRDGIAVIIPCYNEALTIGKVVDDFHRELPEATVYVYENNSTDGTAEIARGRGAVVRLEPRQGKGNVCRQMFRDIEADCYLMVDGDDTYPAESAWALCVPVLAGEADMVVGDRLSNGTYAKQNGRTFHGFGNDLVRAMIKWIYGYGFEDVMTGYRAMSRLVSDLQPWNMQAVRIADGRPMAGIKTSTKCSQLQKSPPACWTSEVSSFERSTNRRFLKFKKGLKSFSVGRRPKSIPTISRLRAYVWHARPRLRCRERKRRGRNTSQRLY